VNQNRVTAPPSYELPPTDLKNKAHNPTSSFPVGALAPVVFKTKPIILVVDVRLMPGEKKTYSFRDKIPPDAPPSYSGGFVKVCYLSIFLIKKFFEFCPFFDKFLPDLDAVFRIGIVYNFFP